MGAKVSSLNDSNATQNNLPLGEYNLQDITRLGKKPVNIIDLRTMIDPSKVYADNEALEKLTDIQKTFDSIIDKKNDRLNNLIRYETLLMNYSTKNRDVIKILDGNIKNQNQGLTDMTESNYTQIAKTRNLMKVNSEIVVTHKIMIIAIIILSIIAISAGVFLAKKKMDNVEIQTI
jgi:hypothetical protein